MLKSIVLAKSSVLALAAVALVGPAMAADMPVKAAPRAVAPAVYNWSGLYVGAHVGGGWSEKCFDQVSPVAPNPGSGCHDATGWLGGGQVGYNWQQSNWLFGIEVSGSALDFSGSHRPPEGSNNDNLTISSKTNSLLLFTGRLGITWSQAVAYVKGGAAWTRTKHRFEEGGQPTIETRQSVWGWTIGTGLEVGITPNWSVAFEYNYVDFGKDNTNLGGNWIIAVDQSMHIGTARLNYRLNAPVVARY